MKRTLPYVLVVFLLGSCETVVDVTPPAHAPRLAAQSFFSGDSLWSVRVTRTVAYATAAMPETVLDASVEIWEGERLVARPAPTDSGTYVAEAPGAVPGRHYTLRVAAPGLPATEGTDALPAPPRIAAYRETLVPNADTTSRRRLTRFEITLDDPPGTDNFYGLVVLQARQRVNTETGEIQALPLALFPFQSDDAALAEDEFDFLNTGPATYHDAFFTDGLFDGSRYTLDFEIRFDEPRPEATLFIERGFVVALLSVSPDFFRYWKTADRQAVANENPFAEPLRVHSNLTGGYGVFAGFQYRLFPTTAGRPDLVFGQDCGLVGGRLPLCNHAAY